MVNLILFFKNIFSFSKVKIFDKNTLVQNGKFLNSYLRISGKNNEFNLGKDSILKKANIKIKGNNNKVIIYENCYIKEMNFEIRGENTCLIIGKNTSIQGIKIVMGRGKIEIGKDCMLSSDIEIRNTDSHKIYKGKELINDNRDIKIESNVWIGTKVIILKGSIIGKGSIVGAGSVVSGKFGDNIIIAGNPAKKIKEDIRWEV